MPSFDDVEISGQLQGFGDVVGSTVKASATNGFQYHNSDSLHRYKRHHWTRVKAIGSGGASVSGPLTTPFGFPASIVISGATEYGYFMTDFNVPLGAQLDTIWFLVQSYAGASQSGKLLSKFYHADENANDQINGVGFAHTNGSPTWYGMNLSWTDTRDRNDPTGGATKEWFLAELEITADTAVGYPQTHYFWGFALEYRIPTGAQFEEST